MKHENEYYRLVDNLMYGRLTYTQIKIAIAYRRGMQAGEKMGEK